MCLQYIHSCSYIYLNIAPQNILVKPVSPGKDANEIFLFDFSLAQLYRDPQTYTHVPFCSSLPLTAPPHCTAFSSINYHLWNQLSHWDDLKSLAYLLIYLVHGSLPWCYPNALADSKMLQ